MNKFILTTGLALTYTVMSYAQENPLPRKTQFVDLTGTVGSSQGSIAASYVHNWRIGKRKKWEAGLGLRYTGYMGSKKDFTTAPAKLSRTTTTPFIIFFAGQKTENWDTLNIKRPFINSINISLNFGYNFSEKISAGFNIDLIGFSFGRNESGILTSDGTSTNEPEAKPSSFNVLLTGDNDIGSLNSEFFLKYKIDNRWGIKAVYQFYFAEYETRTVKQIAPDGTEVYRFRNKANNFGLGVSYHF